MSFYPKPLSKKDLAFFRKDKNPDKHNFLRRIAGKPVDVIPYWEMIIEGQIISTILEKEIPDDVSSLNLDPKDNLELCRRTGMSGIGMGIFFTPARQNHLLNTREGFRRIREEGPPDFSEQFKQLESLCGIAKETSIGVWAYVHGPFDPIYLGMDLQQFWLLTVDDPDYLYEVGDYLLEINTELAKQIVKTGVDWLHIGDDLAFKTGLMVPPKFLYDYYPQRVKQLFQPAKDAGIPVTFHTDGKMDELIEMLIECEVDATHPIEPYSNEIRDIAQIIDGRMAMIGNIELSGKRPEDVYQHTRNLIESLGARYIPASSHSVTNDVDAATYAAFLHAINNEPL